MFYFWHTICFNPNMTLQEINKAYNRIIGSLDHKELKNAFDSLHALITGCGEYSFFSCLVFPPFYLSLFFSCFEMRPGQTQHSWKHCVQPSKPMLAQTGPSAGQKSLTLF